MKYFTLLLACLSLVTMALANNAANDESLSSKVEDLSKIYRLESDKLHKANLGTTILEKRIDETISEIHNLEQTLNKIDQLAKFHEKQGRVAKEQFEEFKRKLSRSNFETLKLDQKLANLIDNYNAVIVNYYMENSAIDSFKDPQAHLFSTTGFDQYLQNLVAFESLENSLKESMQEISVSLQAQKDHQQKVLASTINLQNLKDTFENKVFQAKVASASKNRLLEFTKGEQKIYEQLLQDSIANHKNVEKKVLDILKTYSEVKNQFFDKGFADDIFFGSNKSFLAWPVDPSLGITAYFLDPGYKSFFGVAHKAIDLRAPMGTAIKAPADGVVISVVGGESNDYHYIMLAHSDGVVTLYGHVYDEYVKVGDKIKKGHVIGLTGGMPGTSGAGYMTTGPHLHFEVFKDGKHINPLDLLDTSALKSKDLLN